MVMETEKCIKLYLQKLKDGNADEVDVPEMIHLVLQIKDILYACGSVEEAMERQPMVGQLLGRLCGCAGLLCNTMLLQGLLDSLLWFFSIQPLTVMQHKAKIWAMSQIRGLISYKQETLDMVPLGVTGLSQSDLSSMVLENVLKDVVSTSYVDRKSYETSSIEQVVECCRFSMRMTDQPWFLTLLNKLLQCVIKRYLSQPATQLLLSDITETQSNAYAGAVALRLERETLCELWCSYPASLEQEVLCLLEYLCVKPDLSSQQLQQVADSRGLLEVCKDNVYISGTVMAMINELHDQCENNSALKVAADHLLNLIAPS